MRASSRFPIAVHAMLMIAYFTDVRMTSDIISNSVGCNPVIIRNIFTELKAAGLIHVRPGSGGAKLARTPEDISLWDIFDAVESSETTDMFRFQQDTSGTCPVGSNIRGILLRHLDDTVAAMRTSLESVSLADLAAEVRQIEGFDQDTANEALKNMSETDPGLGAATTERPPKDV